MAESAHLSLRNGLLLVVESRELGPEDGNCLYPLKGIVLNAQVTDFLSDIIMGLRENAFKKITPMGEKATKGNHESYQGPI